MAVTVVTTAVTEVPADVTGNLAVMEVTIPAPAGMQVTGGGWAEVNSDGTDVTAAAGLQIDGSRPSADGSSWQLLVWNSSMDPVWVTGYAVCQ